MSSGVIPESLVESHKRDGVSCGLSSSLPQDVVYSHELRLDSPWIVKVDGRQKGHGNYQNCEFL